MTTTALDDQFAVCTPEEEEAFKAIEARQRECAAECVQSNQRERFETWASGRFELHRHAHTSQYTSKITQAAWESWQAACPEGWQAVPVNWPEGMAKQLAKDIGEEDALCVWAHHKCMLSAAPKPEDV